MSDLSLVQRLSFGLAVLLAAGSRILPAPAPSPEAPRRQSQEEAFRKSAGCISCHTRTDSANMHASAGIRLGCADCHGGDPAAMAAGTAGSKEYERAKRAAHVAPRNEALWRTSANPQRSYAAFLAEDLDFVRFVNPGDLRAATKSCAPCHEQEVRNVSTSMMTHGGMLYGAVLYNNGVLPLKDTVVGESYGADGKPRMITMNPAPTAEETREKGLLPFLLSFPRWELGQPGNVLRVFERGGRRRLEVGLPDREEEPGKPDKGLSPRGPGTLNRTDPFFLGAQKTRLMDPLLSLVEVLQGDPQERGNFFLDFYDGFGSLQPPLEPGGLPLELFHAGVLGFRLRTALPRLQLRLRRLLPLTTPQGQVGRVQSLASQQGPDLTRAIAGIGLPQDPQLVLGREPPPLGTGDHLRVGGLLGRGRPPAFDRGGPSAPRRLASLAAAPLRVPHGRPLNLRRQVLDQSPFASPPCTLNSRGSTVSRMLARRVGGCVGPLHRQSLRTPQRRPIPTRPLHQA